MKFTQPKFTHRATSIALLFALCFGLIPTPQTQAYTSHSCTSHGGGTQIQLNDRNIAKYSTLSENKLYYLGEDITADLLVTGSAVSLCLNGFTLTGTGKGPALTIQSGALLTLYDKSSNTGCITGGCSTTTNGHANGGGVYVGGGRFQMEGGNIQGNTATQGGGVYLDSGSSFTMTGGAKVSNNTATIQGGGIMSNASTITIQGASSVTGNTAFTGGGIYASGSNLTLSSNSTISQNTSQIDGGGILASGSTLTLQGTITSNSAGNNGGGLYLSSASILDLSSGSVSVNTATGEGGGIYLASHNCQVNLSGIPKITNNKGKNLTDNLSIQTSGSNVSTVSQTSSLASGASIGLNLRESGAFLPGLVVHGSGNINSNNYSSDSNLYLCQVETDKNLYLVTELTPEVFYTVSFHTQSYAIAPYTQVPANTTISAPTSPTRVGYLFAGWYTTSAYTTPWNFQTDLVNKDMTLYAKWDEIPKVEEEEKEDPLPEPEDSTSTTPDVTTPTIPGQPEEESPQENPDSTPEDQTSPEETPSEDSVIPPVIPEENQEEDQTLEDPEEETPEEETPEPEKEPYIPTPEQPFEDVEPDDWYYESVGNVNDQGYMSGTSSTTFSPDTNTTRAMIAVILYNIQGSPNVQPTDQFPDVATTDYFAQAVAWSVQEEVFAGYSEGVFRPHENISRQHLALVMYQYAQRENPSQLVLFPDLSSYVDLSSIHGYAYQGVIWAISQGILTGRSATTLNPQGEATRGEVAVMVDQFAITDPVI